MVGPKAQSDLTLAWSGADERDNADETLQLPATLKVLGRDVTSAPISSAASGLIGILA